MGKMTRGTSWREHRLADRMELGGTTYTVDLVGRRATGVQGYRMTVVFLPHEGGDEVEVSLPNAASTAEFHRIARELEADPDRIAELFRSSRNG
ncbi:MAG TPA: hypothetical protein VKZ58_11215 [Longimicrobiales bacterium]|nr:hypothetical protein [Longimicrobiales bacterium]